MQAVDALPTRGPTGFRSAVRMIAASVRLVWRAAPRELLIVLAMDLLQAVGVFVLVLQVQKVLAGLVSSDNGGSAPGLVLNLVTFVLANVLIVVAEAVIANRRTMLGERTAVYVCGEVLAVSALAQLDDFDRSAFHDRLQRAAASALSRPMRLVSSLIMIVQALFTVLALWVALLLLQPWIALCLLPVVFPIWIGGTRGGRQYFDFVEQTTSGDRGRTYLFQLLTARDSAKEIRAFNLADHLTGNWRSSMNERLRLLAATLRRRLLSSLISSLGSNAVLAVAAVALIALNRLEVLTLAETATVAGALLVLSQKLLEAITSTNEFFESAPLVGDLDDFISLAPTLRGQRGGAPFEGRFDRLELDRVRFTYQDADRPALDGVSLDVRAGEVIALVGENGSGKTTLAKLLAGLYTPQQGAVLVDGTDLATLDSAAWRASVAVMFQDYLRYAMPAWENVWLGDIERDIERDGDRDGERDGERERDLSGIREAARAAGADSFLSRLPNGYDTILGPQFGEGLDLSLGQWQRVALARAFYRAAPLVILDEPSASLDARAERALFDSVRDLYRGRTVLLISHRFSTVRSADRIVVLDQGQIVEQGTHAELMATGGLYAELFSIQASGFLEDALPSPSVELR